MFKKIFDQTPAGERAHIHSLLSFNLAVFLRFTELLALFLLMAGPGWLIGDAFTRSALGFPAGSVAAIGVMLVMIGLIRSVTLVARGRLAAAFGLDPRPERTRLTALLARGGRSLLLAWPVSAGLFWAVVKLPVPAWAAIMLGSGLAWLLARALRPALLSDRACRLPRPGELPPDLTERLTTWAPKTGLGPERLRIATGFTPWLTAPRLCGLGPGRMLVIDEKALSTFTPRELKLLTVAAAMSSLAGCPLKLFLLRLCALAIAAPLAAILFLFQGMAWGYPYLANPALITCLWAGFWLGALFAEVIVRLVQRQLTARLEAVAMLLLHDEAAMASAARTLAVRNLEEDAPPVWRNCLNARHGRELHLRQVRQMAAAAAV